jgi:hypothetical protein
MMQTFLPYPSFQQTAECLDMHRLNNQINEALIILRTLTGWYSERGKKGWPNHPAVKMWKGYEVALAEYAMYCLTEYCNRQRRLLDLNRANDILNISNGLPDEYWDNIHDKQPSWLGLSEFHASHRAALLSKNPEWYGQFGWTEQPEIDYIWPVS